jgi:hypothetical protein
VAANSIEPAAPRGVQFVAGLPMAVEDKIGKQGLRARYGDP